MANDRKAGVLLHVTSLPSKYGVGTLGSEAYKFVDWLKKAKMKIWQVLPLTPTNYGDSPYQSVSSTALNYYLIDFDVLREKGLLKESDYKNIKFYWDEKRVDYSLLFNNKVKVLEKAFQNFKAQNKNYEEILKNEANKDFSVFMTIKALNNYKAWSEWPLEYKKYNPCLEDNIIKKYKDAYYFWQWTQYEFLEEWNKLHTYAKDNGIEIMGDMPLYVAYDSVEVWKYPELFILGRDNEPKEVAGCPPDCFTEDGQLWGNPVYDWDYHRATGYKWWDERIKACFNLYDYLRIDHFRGFADYYSIPYGEKTARNGRWIEGPRFDFFKDKLDLNIVAEDLGFIDEPVRELMKQTKYPGMKILEFAFDGHEDNEHKPSNYTENYLVYTGTHDNMPLNQYIKDLTDEELETYDKDLASEAIELCVEFDSNVSGSEYRCEKVCELAFASVAKLCIIPMQDLLNLGKEARMNLPATVSTDNWSYRINKSDLSKELQERLAMYVDKYNR